MLLDLLLCSFHSLLVLDGILESLTPQNASKHMQNLKEQHLLVQGVSV